MNQWRGRSTNLRLASGSLTDQQVGACLASGFLGSLASIALIYENVKPYLPPNSDLVRSRGWLAGPASAPEYQLLPP